MTLNCSVLTCRYIRELEDRLVSLEYSVQTKGHVSGREHSPPSRRRLDYSGGGRTPPHAYDKPHSHPNEPVKLNPVLGSHSRSHLDRLPPIETIQGSPSSNNEKRHSADYFRPPYHPSAHRLESLSGHSYHQNQHDLHISPDRRDSVDKVRKPSFSGHSGHERVLFNETISRRPSDIPLPAKLPPPTDTLPIDEAAINR